MNELEAQKELIELKDRLEHSITGSSSAIWDLNVASMSGYISTRWQEMLGYTKTNTEYTFEQWLEYIHQMIYL